MPNFPKTHEVQLTMSSLNWRRVYDCTLNRFLEGSRGRHIYTRSGVILLRTHTRLENWILSPSEKNSRLFVCIFLDLRQRCFPNERLLQLRNLNSWKWNEQKMRRNIFSSPKTFFVFYNDLWAKLTHCKIFNHNNIYFRFILKSNNCSDDPWPPCVSHVLFDADLCHTL